MKVSPTPVEGLSLLPNRLAVAEFGPREVDQILDKADQAAAAEAFNWLAAYLCEEVGLYEHELVDWFRGEAQALTGCNPLSVWRGKDGMARVFDYAKIYKAQVEEALGDQETEDDMSRAHRLAGWALPILEQAFRSAGVALPGDVTNDEYGAVYNPDKGHLLIASWKSRGYLTGWRISSQEGGRQLTYYINKVTSGPESPLILQTGVASSLEGEAQPEAYYGSDIDGRAPTVGQVALLVLPLLNEIKNRSLAPLGNGENATL